MKQITIIDGTKTFTWYDNDNGVVLNSYEGFEYPTTLPIIVNLPGRSGAHYVSSKYGQRGLSWGGDVVGDNRYSVRRSMLNALNPGTLKTLKFTTFDDLNLQCEVEVIAVRHPYSAINTFLIEAIAPDYRFYSQTLTTQTTPPTAVTGGAGLPTILPINFGNITGVPKLTLTNNGTESCPPIFIIRGSGTNFTIQNTTTNEILRINTTLVNTDEVVINTLEKTVIKNGTTNLFGSTSGDFWYVPTGTSYLHFDVQSGGTASTTITIEYRDTYIGI